MFIGQFLDFYNSVLQECIWEAEVELSVNAIKVVSKETLDDRLVFSDWEKKSNEHSVTKDLVRILCFHEKICPIIGGLHLIPTIFFGDGWYFIIIQRFMLRFSPNYGTAFQMLPTGGGRCHERIVTTKSKGIFFPFHWSFWGQWRHDYFQTDYKEDNCLSSEKAALDYLQPCSKVIRHVH